jgi:hypothetical protein
MSSPKEELEKRRYAYYSRLPDEENFLEEFERFMIDCGLQVREEEIARARAPLAVSSLAVRRLKRTANFL